MTNAARPTIAVVAMSGVLPKATGAAQFWRNIIDKVDASVRVYPERWPRIKDWVFDPLPTSDKTYSDRACLIDASEFDFSACQHSDTIQIERLPLPYQWAIFSAVDAFGRCNIANYDKKRIGTILAAIALPTRFSNELSWRVAEPLLSAQFNPSKNRLAFSEVDKVPTRRVVAMPAALIAQAIGLGGGTYTLDAACASSLYAVKLACDELQAYRADAMITGGASMADTLYTQIGFSQLRAFSHSGRCAPFDRSADGLVVGEGAGVMVLKRLDDALADNDTIFGIIRGIGLSNDMRGNLLAPDSEGQLRAMRAAYREAQWQPEDVDYIECHGAGTPVGDATELNSLRILWQANDWQKGQCAIGSVKSMIGHLLTGAGAAGMIKTLLALHHQTLPPSLRFRHPPEGSPLIDGPYRVQTEPLNWEVRDKDTPRRAAVSAFGFGGINAHILLEEGPQHCDNSVPANSAPIEAGGKRVSRNGGSSFNPNDEIAIVGMDLTLGELTSIHAFQRAVFNSAAAMRETPPNRWKSPQIIKTLLGDHLNMGGFIEEIVLEMGEFHIPPGEILDILPQQLLMLKVAAGAMQDAGLPLREPRERMGTIIGIGFDYEANNFNLRWTLPDVVEKWRQAFGLEIDEATLADWLHAARDGCGPPLTPSRTLGALGGIVSSRIAREFKFGGPSFVVSAEEASGLRAVEIAARMLQSGQTDAMLVGAVDLTCDERNLATLFDRSSISPSGHVRPFDQSADGTMPGEGAVALVLKRLEDARQHQDRIYAVINGTGAAIGGGLEGSPPSPSTYVSSLQRAINEAHISADEINLIETHGSGVPTEDDTEAEALSLFFGKGAPTRESGCMNGIAAIADSLEYVDEKRPPCHIAIGTLKPLIGHTGVTSGLASLAKTALSLFHHLVPPSPGFTSPRYKAWHGSPFYFPKQTAYWATEGGKDIRTACVAAMTQDGNCMHVIMRGADYHQLPPLTPTLSPGGEGALARESGSNDYILANPVFLKDQRRPMGPLPYALFCIHGEDPNALLRSLDQLEQISKSARTQNAPETLGAMERLGHQWFQQNRPNEQGSESLAILTHSPDDLQARIDAARQAVRTGEASYMGARGGVCYLPSSVKPNGQIAFIYPGSGCHDVGMGRTLGAHWPEVLRAMNARTDRFKSQMLPHLYDPWRADWQAGWQNQSYKAISADPLHGIFGQVVFGSQMTYLLKGFNIHPEAVIGYSLGESAGLFALGAWPDHGRMLGRLSESDLFKTQLTGPCRSLQRAWGLPDDHTVLWRVAVINRPAGHVDEALADLPHVRRLIINTPNECVIGGLADQVGEVIRKLKCEALDLDGVVTVHCDAALPVAGEYEALHRFPTTPVPGVRFYSCARGEAYDLTSEAAAASIRQQALEGFDFTRTIQQAYDDGVRLFLEVGPQASCTRMIRQILADRPHLAVAAHIRGDDEVLALLKCVGTAAAAGVQIDLGFLYDYEENLFRFDRPEGSDAIRVPVGGKPFSLPPLPLASKPNVGEPEARLAPIQDATLEQDIIAPPADNDDGQPALRQFEVMMADLSANTAATARAHEQFLSLSQEMTRQYGETFDLQSQLLGLLAGSAGDLPLSPSTPAPSLPQTPSPAITDPIAFDRDRCMEFAIGSVARVLGPQFDIIDTYKVRVRLPDEPLMLVDRILQVEGEKCSLGSGRVETEHDVLPGAWYLDGDRAPVCISVEAGQADLFLSSYLGIDHRVKGERAYRLLDAEIHFHRGLPRPGETIRYDIHIDKFVQQGATYLFFFRFEGYIGDQHLITMTNGCAGFFTEQEVRNSGGIILTDTDRTSDARVDGTPMSILVPIEDEAYGDDKIEALRAGDAQSCFGPSFEGIQLPPALRLPGGRMRLIDRVLSMEPGGGRWGLGCIKAEADIHPNDWFLTCHFVDDKVMPGTLMYECCAHTLRVLLLRMGWITDQPEVAYEPIQGIPCRLKCRGPVTPGTRHVHYVVEIKEIGSHPEPYVLADAHMYADGHYIVFFKDMSMQMTGVSGDDILNFWQRRSLSLPLPSESTQTPPVVARPEIGALYTREQILEFAVGSPSKAYGEPYRVFDSDRKIARLPGPPYCFMDRVTTVEPPPWVLTADGWVEAQYEVPATEWYFAADRSGIMPFCVLLEIALQPCGWLAAYAGSALKSEKDLKFRNLGGNAVQHVNMVPSNPTLTMRTRITKVSEAADMIIEHFDFEVLSGSDTIYTGNTYFGFFTPQALAQQVGLREPHYAPDENDLRHTGDWPLPNDAPLTPDESPADTIVSPEGLRMPAKALRMIDAIDLYNPAGGPHGLGYIRGYKTVDPQEWFFKAHFYQDPVCPGSLGVESFLQLIKYAALQKWPELIHTHGFEMLCDTPHEWQYRGQVIPANKKVQVDAVITRVDEGPEPVIMADGWLRVDDLYIYMMKGFGIKLRRLFG